MGPPMNLMLRYFQSDRPCNPNKAPIYSIASSSSAVSKDKGKGKMYPDSVGEKPGEKPNVVDLGSADEVDEECVKKRKRAYEMKRHFQDTWTAKFPWVESVRGKDGEVTQVRCFICSSIEGREKLLVPKIDGLWKHQGRKKARKDLVIRGEVIKAGSFYFVKGNAHSQNEKLYYSRPQCNVARQMERQETAERARKEVQFTALFHVMSRGKPMTDYEALQGLFAKLNVSNNPKKHWCDNSGWEMALSLNHVITMKVRETLCLARYVSLSADEVTTIDNQSWLSVHAYVVKGWRRLPLLLSVARVVGGCTAETLHSMIVSALTDHGNVSAYEVQTKLVSFGADGAASFQGCRGGVGTLLVKQDAPFCFTMHCVAHRTNLAMDCLANLSLVNCIDNLCGRMYSFFHKSPKRYAEFEELCEELEAEALKMLRNVKTRWISIYSPCNRVLSHYMPLIVKMHMDSDFIEAARKNLDLLLDLQTLLSFPAILPLLSAVNNLVKFAQSREVYICDFIAAVKLCQADLYSMFVDESTWFQAPHHQAWCDIVSDHSVVLQQDWRADMNTGTEFLSLRIDGQSYGLHIKAGDFNCPVSREDFATVTNDVKRQCQSAAQLLIRELDTRFPDTDLLNALGVIFPQYWLQSDCEIVFVDHLAIIKKVFGESRSVEVRSGEGNTQKAVAAMLDCRALELSSSLFKITMLSNSPKVMADKESTVNPVSRLWTSLNNSSLLKQRLPEWFKLAEIAIVTVIGSVEDERTFSNLSFIKNKLRNRLSGNLDPTLKLFAQDFFTLSTFPYQQAYDHWNIKGNRMGAGF